jgi:hypothetical protein
MRQPKARLLGISIARRLERPTRLVDFALNEQQFRTEQSIIGAVAQRLGGFHKQGLRFTPIALVGRALEVVSDE